MCGIAGIFSPDRSAEVSQLKKMTDAIAHRGPDGEGHWLSQHKQVGFGHRRLAIIDLTENGIQPMHYDQKRYTIIFNGEIYNYIELRKELEADGYSFHTNSDTEVLLALFAHKREACLKKLDGMFAFAIWDDKEQTLFCARDRFGEKPFYYSQTASGDLIFASEMKALWAAGVKKIPSDSMFKAYIDKGDVQDRKNSTATFYSDIYQLEAANCFTVSVNDPIVKQREYWSLDTVAKVRMSEEEAVDRFFSLFSESISLRLRSDVAVGSSLSGGLDSSSIVMLINKMGNSVGSQNTFSGRFKNHGKDEGRHIKAVLDACTSISAHEVWPDEEEMVSQLTSLCYHQEEPFHSASVFAQWKVMWLAREQNVTVLLDGQGADEILAGYLPYYSLYLNQLFYHDKSRYVKEYASINTVLKEYKFPDLIEQETLRMKFGRISRQLLNLSMPVESEALHQALLNDSQRGGLKTLLRYADRNSMAHSREIRLPFLSHKLAEFVFSLPDDLKLHEGWTKYILRKSMEKILPPSITWRTDKIGYEPPQERWLQSQKMQSLVKSGRKKAEAFTGGKANANDWQMVMIDQYFN